MSTEDILELLVFSTTRFKFSSCIPPYCMEFEIG
ncbi:hypothetical protein AALP_AA8G345800 [Arabis alpina]|uniref:Uncharacterized protein n=1 Tax=Arabis alpina TaxID=50452 RepID=A0A087GBC5_ARAAL|nr:hypothetical protein AALP_AA8G345800 [Arabis alpina]